MYEKKALATHTVRSSEYLGSDHSWCNQPVVMKTVASRKNSPSSTPEADFVRPLEVSCWSLTAVGNDHDLVQPGSRNRCTLRQSSPASR
jgi:hypothetical protein